MTRDDAYFRASDSRIRFELDPVGARTPKDRLTVLLLRVVAWYQRKKEARLFRKIEAAIRADDQPSLMILYGHLANLYTAFGHTATLLEVRKQSLRLAERLHEWPFAAAMSYRAGDCAWDLGLKRQAVELQKKALDYAERAGDQSIMADACERLGFLDEETDPACNSGMDR